jgi:thiamine-phosphate pyrophosphorylase
MSERAEPVARAARVRGVYLLTPEWDDEQQLLDCTAGALAAGVGLLQMRRKSGSTPQRLALARRLRELTHRHDAVLIVNDDIELALAVGADGVHLGRDDGDPAAARRRLPATAILGVSCYNDLERARAAIAAGADYVAFGSVFASATKPDAVRAPVSLLTRARAAGQHVVAIGGIDETNIAQVAAAGAHAAALISAVYAPDPVADAAPDRAGSAVRRLCEQFERALALHQSQLQAIDDGTSGQQRTAV